VVETLCLVVNASARLEDASRTDHSDSRASAILDEFVELAIGRSEVNVALLIVLGWIIDDNSGRSEFDDRTVEVLYTEPDRTVGITHAMWIGDSEVRSIRECVQVGLNTADLRAPEAEDVLNKDGHLSPVLRRSSCKHKPEYAHERAAYGIHPLTPLFATSVPATSRREGGTPTSVGFRDSPDPRLAIVCAKRSHFRRRGPVGAAGWSPRPRPPRCSRPSSFQPARGGGSSQITLPHDPPGLRLWGGSSRGRGVSSTSQRGPRRNVEHNRRWVGARRLRGRNVVVLLPQALWSLRSWRS
jgi:hypothetical protein